MSRVWLVVIGLFLALQAVPTHAQEPQADQSSGSVVTVPEPEPSAQAVQGTSGLPERAPQARTMRAYWHVFIAFGVTWLLLFGYALTVGKRFGQLESEVRRLGSGDGPG